jgi:L-threonylcarbamoyladenylate synthase
VSVEELSEHVRIVDGPRVQGTCESPGELPYHYAPMKPLRLVDGPSDVTHEASSYLAFRAPAGKVGSRHVRVLSPSGDLREAASNFFSALIDLDRDDVDVIYAEKLPERGIGRAVMERLRKASRKHPAGAAHNPLNIEMNRDKVSPEAQREQNGDQA